MNEENKKEKRGIRSFLQWLDTVTLPVIFPIVFTQALYFMPYLFGDDLALEEFLGGKLIPITAAAVLIPAFYFIFRLTVYDNAMEARFWEYPSTVRITEKLGFLFRQRDFCIEFALIALVQLILPLTWTNAALADLFAGDDAGGGRRLIIKLLFLLTVFVLDILAHLSVFNVWYREKIEHPNKKRTKAERDRQFMITVLPWEFGFVIIQNMLPYFMPLLSVIKQIFFNTTTLTVIAAAVVALFAFIIIRAVHKRRKFYSELSSLCRNYGFTISPVNHLLMSVFKITAGENFNITANGKKYSCKLIGALSKNDPLAIYDNGTCTFIHPVRFLKVTWMHYVRSYAYGYETEPDVTKVIIVNPVAKELLTGKDGRNVPIDNGDDVGGYKVYAGTAFINALRRDTVEKNVN